MRAAYDEYSTDGFEVLAISIQESDSPVIEFKNLYGLSNPFLMDRDGQISRTYQVFATPTTFFVDKNGVITDILPGVVSTDWLETNIKASLETSS